MEEHDLGIMKEAIAWANDCHPDYHAQRPPRQRLSTGRETGSYPETGVEEVGRIGTWEVGKGTRTPLRVILPKNERREELREITALAC